MSNTNQELKIIANIKAIREEIAAKELKLREATAGLRAASAAEDQKITDEAKAVLDEAEAALAALQAEKTGLERQKAAIEADWDAGTNAYTENDALEVDYSLRRVSGNLKAAGKSVAAARRAHEPLAADNHLAHLAADVLQTVTSVPVLVRKRVQDAPALSPAIVLSQTTDTIGYGTLDASGHVALTVVGDAGIDWRVIRLAFEDAGCEVSVSANGIEFQSATWPIPVLAQPSPGEVTKWADIFGEAWVAHVETREGADRLRAAGYTYVNGATGWEGYGKVNSTELTCGDGSATGTARLSLASTEGLSIQEITRKVEDLVSIFEREHVGLHTHAGEIVSIDLGHAEVGNRGQWSGTFYNTPPQTVDVTIEIEYRYVPAEVAC